MNDERWKELMDASEPVLTPAEIIAGWHFCWDWDGLLVGPGMMEKEFCTCQKEQSTPPTP